MTKKALRVAVLCGGSSQERDVSLRSGANVLNALQALGHDAFFFDPAEESLCDLSANAAFLALHGPEYEDGTIQAQLELFNIPYTGNGCQASIITMNKLLTKELCKRFEVPSPDYLYVFEPLDQLPEPLSFPVILKPLSEGSSIDIYICDTQEELSSYSQQLVDKYGDCLLEEFIEGKELTVGVLQNPDTLVLPILELRPKNRFYDYEAKYTEGMTEFILPAEISAEEEQQLNSISSRLFSLLGCHGMARFDFRYCSKRGPFILDVNTIPGLTNTSDLPAQAKQAGISFNELIAYILDSAFTR